VFNTEITTPGQMPETTTGTLSFEDGSASFKLMHDQKIEILDVPLDYDFRIKQNTDASYVTDYKDSTTTGNELFTDGNDTGGMDDANRVMRRMTMSRRISFRNRMRDVTDTGLISGSASMFGLLMLLGIGSLVSIILAHLLPKLKRRLIWRRMLGYYKEREEL